MITKLLVFILVAILLVVLFSTLPCEREKALKLKMLSATRKQLGDAAQSVIECNLAVKLIETEIASLRDKIVLKKVNELKECTVKFNEKIDTYKALYKTVNEHEADQSHIDDLKRRLGITGL
jgi:hypothetical protein